MADIFGRRSMEFGGAFSADAAQIAFSFSTPRSGVVDRGGVGLLTQQLNFVYQQQITRLYEIGSQRTFYVAGRSQGNAQLARVAGPREITMAFYYKFGNVCCAKDNILQFRAAAMCYPVGTGTTTVEQFSQLAGGQVGIQGGGEPGVRIGSTGTSLNLKMTAVVITSIGFTVQAENMVINEQVQVMFVSLEADDTSYTQPAYTCGEFIPNVPAPINPNPPEQGPKPKPDPDQTTPTVPTTNPISGFPTRTQQVSSFNSFIDIKGRPITRNPGPLPVAV